MNLAIPAVGPSWSSWLTRAAAVGVSLLAVLVLADWVTTNPMHASMVMPSHMPMKASSALGLVGAAIALWLLARPSTPAWRKRVALGFALAVAMLGAATLFEYLTGISLGIDQPLGPGTSSEFNTTNPERIAPEIALNLVLVGMALYGMTRPRLLLAAQAITVLVAMLGLFNLVGYFYGAAAFYKLDHKSSIGVATALAFVALGTGMLAARPEGGLVRSMTSRLPGGVVIRRLMLAVLVLPLALGWLEIMGERAGLFSHALGSGMAGAAGSIALMILIWRTAKVLDRRGQALQKADEALHQSNELLKQSVRERTVLLANANQSLSRGATERERMEALLRLQSSALESAANAISIADRTGVIEWVNPAFCSLTGYGVAEAIGSNPLESTDSGLQDGATKKTVWTTILEGKVWRGELVYRRKDGTNYTVFQTITPVRDKGGAISHFISIKEDITEKKRLEELALRAQRVQNLGLLAAGIAHDFNNVLAPIVMAAPMLRPQVASAAGQRMLDIVEQCSGRGAGLVRQMLSFARGTADQKMALQVHHVLREVVCIARTTFPKSIRIKTDLPGDLRLVLGDPTQINQVFMNLTINARDAMPQGGEISIIAANVELDAGAAAEIAEGRPGSFVAIEVRDTGTGIEPEVLRQIWEPFFTTKREGKGTGLGLTTVRGIVRQHGGFVGVQTTSQLTGCSGTAFTVYLPAVIADITAGAPPGNPGGPARRGEGELILVVDDEECVIEIVEKILVSQGYRVVTASDGAEAIAVFGSRAGEVRLLITDNDMPFIGGKTLIAALRRQSPHLPVVVISGSGSADADTHGLSEASHLPKPFDEGSLITAVRRTLDGARSAAPCLVET